MTPAPDAAVRSRGAGANELSGAPARVPEGPIRCQLTVSHSDFVMQNHRVHGVSVMPGVALLDAVFRILRARGIDPASVLIRDVLFTEPIATADGLDRQLRIVVGSASDGICEITAESRALRHDGTAGNWRRNLVASLVRDDPQPAPLLDVEALKAGAERVRDMAELYAQARREEIVHGPPMQCVGRLYLGGDGLLAEIDLDESTRSHEHRFHLHPAKLDASTLIAFAWTSLLEAPFIPISVASVRAPRSLHGRCYVHVPRTETVAPSGDAMHNDYRIYDATGELLAELTRLTCKRIRFPGLITELLEEPSPAAPQASGDEEPAVAPAGVAAGDAVGQFAQHVRVLVARKLGVKPAQIDTTTGFYDQGLDSVAMLRISEELETVVRARLYPTLLFEFGDIDSLARYLAETYRQPAQPPAADAPLPDPPSRPSAPAELRAYRRVWQPAPVRPTEAKGDLLLLALDEHLGAATAEALRAQGDRVTLAVPGDELVVRDAAGPHRVDFSRPQLEGLLDELATNGQEPRALVVLAADGSNADGRKNAHTVFWAAACAVATRRPTEPTLLCFVASGDDGAVKPEYAAIGALARTFSAETSVLHCRSVAVEDAMSANDLASVMAREVRDRGGEVEIRYRDGRRQAPSLDRVDLTVDGRDPLKRNGVYLLSGGGGALGRRLAAHLVERYDARLVLTGRSDPDADLEALLQAWRGAGAEVDYMRADVADLEGARSAVEHAKLLYGRLHGVFHLAGAIDDTVFFHKDPARMTAVLAPKVQGAVNLDLATEDEPLEAFVLFSSISAVLPNAGQSDYAYANAFLDHFAAGRAERATGSGVTVAIGWPYWAEGGMRGAAAATERDRSTTRLEPLPTNAGLEALDALLRAGEPHVAVVYGDPEGIEQALGENAAARDNEVDARERTRAAARPAATPAEADPARAATTDIAIIGFAGKYPQAPDIPAFWRNLVNGRDSITEVPADRWDHGAFFDPAKGRAGKTYSRWGGFVDGIDRFAPAFFNISRREAERMDPQERLFLQACWHALEDAGYVPERLKAERVGVFAGVMWNHYQLLEREGVAPMALHSSVPNRASYCFDLTGPSVAVDTACSSSLVALHLAAESIKSGDATMALAGGVNVTVHPQKYLQLAEDEFLSEDGRCRAFGSGGTGYVPGEGVGVVVLKRLDRAIADADHVDGVIKGSAVNHSGKTSGFTVPDPAAQADLIRAAVGRAGVPVSSLSYVEAHGTGTSLGDPIEIEGLSRAFADAELRPGSCAIGSVKSNIGHLESAAGVAGVHKVLLQMRHRELVPSLHTDELNAEIPFESSPFVVQRRRSPWVAPEDGLPLRAGVSAFGAGGANAHVILESFAATAGVDDAASSEPELVALSAPDEDALRRLAAALVDRLSPTSASDDATVLDALRARVAELAGIAVDDVDPDVELADFGLDRMGVAAVGRLLTDAGAATNPLPDLQSSMRELASASGAADELPVLRDLAFTLQVGRRALAARLAVVVETVDELRARLRQFLDDGDVGDAGCWGVVAHESRSDPECVDLLARGRLHEVARRWVDGAAVDWPARGRCGEAQRVSLPGTPLPEERCWLGAWARSDAAATASGGRELPKVELKLLGSGIALLVIQDEANRNMFTDELLRSLENAFAQIRECDDVNVVVLTGTDQVFCMGGSPDALEALAAKDATFTDAAFVYEGLLRCEKPVVAAIRGHASGGGLAFGLYADVVVMSRDGAYSANFLRYGFTPGMGASYILEHRFGAALAAEMMFTGRTYRGDELERRGAQVLFDDPDQVLQTALNLARSIASMPADALKALKGELARRTLDRLPEVIASELAMHDRVLGEEALELVRERLDKTGAAATAVQANGDAPAPSTAPSPAPPENVRSAVAAPAVVPPVDIATDDVSLSDVVEVIERTLSRQLYLEPHEIDHSRSFSDMGADSIGAVEIVRDLNHAFGTDLDSVTVYDHPTVGQLAELVLRIRSEGRALRAAAVSTPFEPDLPATDQSDTPTPPPPRAHLADPAPRAADRERRRRARVTLSPVTKPDLDGARPSATNEIAVVGMSGRFPDADDLDAFWDNLARGHSAIREIPPERWDADAVFDANVNAEGKTYSRWAALLSDVETFDHRFFNVSPLEAQETDPQQRLFLTEAWKALEDAGYAGSSGERRRCGVFVGCAPGDYAHLLSAAGRMDSGHAFLGNSGSILAARIAYFLDFHGPTVAVDTACSSSLVAVHLACQSLRCGETDMALAGGVAVMLTPSLHVRSSRIGMLSPTGTSAPFDAAADGIVLGEGVGVVVLKRMADAIADGDYVHGVIKSSGANGDGKTNGITAPSASSQAALLRRVHADAGITARDITYVEAHGTGTALGDPIEFTALTQVFADARGGPASCGLGSVKANVGHTTMAAGIAGLLKVLLALRQRELPPSTGFTEANPKIDFDGSPLYMVREQRPWMPAPSGQRIAAVSSFGFSGTNCHVVVGERPPPLTRRNERTRRPELVPVSARTPSELDAQLGRLAQAVSPEHDLADVAFTLALGRRHLAARAAVVADDIDDLRTKLAAFAAGSVPPRCAGGVVETPPDETVPVSMDDADLERLAEAYVAGQPLDWTSRFENESPRRVPLPPYPFTGERHRVAPASSAAPAARRDDAATADHPSIDAVGPPGDDEDGVVLHPAHPLVADHRIGGRPLLPGAASVELVVSAAQRLGYALPVRLSRVRWLRPFEVDRRRALAVTLRDAGNGFGYTLGEEDSQHGTGVIEELPAGAAPGPVDLLATTARCPRTQDPAELYDAFDAAGMRYGPSFRRLRSVVAGPDEAVSTLREADDATTVPPTVPAAVLDAGFQTIAALVDPDDPTPLLPVGARSIDVYASLDEAAHAVVRRNGRQQYDIDLTDRAGRVLVRVEALMLRPGDELDGKVYAPVWRDAGPASTPKDPERAAVFCRPQGRALAEALLRRLSAAEAVLLPYDDDCDPDLTVLQRPYDCIYLLAGVGPNAGPPERDRSASMLLRIVRTLVDAGRAEDALTLKLVADGAVATAPDEPVRPHAAALVGLSRTVAAEYPDWRVACLDVGTSEQHVEDVAAALASEDAAERLVALRDGRRLVRAFEPLTLPRSGSPFRERGVYVVLGGAGGIGSTLSLHLARTARARLVWIGRRPEDNEIRRRAAAVAAAGGEVAYLRADAANAEELTAAIAEARLRFGAITGAFHAAMTLDDMFLRDMDVADLDRVLAAKVAGAVNLHRALEGDPLDFLAFFSSAVSFVDSAGQGNYAAASTFEDAYALHLRRTGAVHALVINWGYWGSVGAVANDYHRVRLAADGVGSIEPPAAMTALERALAAGVEQVLVIEANAAGLAHFGIGADVHGAAAPRSDDARVERGQLVAPAPESALVDHAAAARYVRGVFAEVLGYSEHELDEHTTFEQFGVDSVVGRSIVDRLERDLGPLPSTLLFEEMTVARLATRLVADRGKALASVVVPATKASEPAAPATPARRFPARTRPAESSPARRNEDIAVIGVAGRYPGAPDLQTFWRNLAAGVSGITEVPAERWDWKSAFDPRKGLREYQRWGGFLDGVDKFDAALFGILPKDAVDIDPQERLFLETCWNLVEEAGYLGELSHEPSTGVFAGLMYGTYGELGAQAWANGEISGAHSAYWSIANRVSYTFDFGGPSFAVDSACSSSLTAVHLACESIGRGNCKMAIAGGVNLILHPLHFIALGARNMLASDGAVKVFDTAADGYVPGEGVGAVLLKPLPDALTDGDDVWAVIKGTAINAGGKTSGYTVPNPNAQAQLVEEAIRRAGVEPETITYIEAHGSGTELGDPIEVAGIASAFHSLGGGPPRCSIGSVKSNIGHLEGAAGIAGLTKVLLQLRHQQLVPTINLSSLNPKIDFESTPFEPQRSLAEWPTPQRNGDGDDEDRTCPRRAGVSSFGAGGANVHVVVEEYERVPPLREPDGSREHLFLLSAPDRERLIIHAEAVADFLEGAPPELALADLAYTSQVGRRAFDERLAVVARDRGELVSALRGFGRGVPLANLIVGAAGTNTSIGALLGDPGGAAFLDQLAEAGDLEKLARAWTLGVAVDWRRLWPAPTPRRVVFPTTPFSRKRYWIAPPPAQEAAREPLREAIEPATTVERRTRLEYERPVWEPEQLGPAAPSVRMVLVVASDEAVGAAVGARLDARRIDHVVVPAAGALQAADELAARGQLPDAVVHVGAGRLDPSHPEDADAAFRTLFRLAVDLLARGQRVRVRLLCARLGSETGEQPHLAALLPLLKTLAQEHGCTGACVALETDAPEVVAERIVDELTAGHEVDVAYRRGVRLVKRMQRVNPPAGATDWASPDGTYVITGGAGALGLHFARLLAERGAGDIVLVGRSQLDPERAARVAALDRDGIVVRYERADVAAPADLDRLVTELRRAGKPLRGVIHAAGVIRDAPAVDKTPAQLDDVLSPKVAGTLNLDRATADDPLDFFVLFSSVVGETGNRGQADYSYANAFLDAFAETRERWRADGRRRGRSLSIGWSLWRDGGMTVDQPTATLLERQWGMVPMSTRSGLAAFEALLHGSDPVVHVVEKIDDVEIDDEPPAGPVPLSAAPVPATAAAAPAVDGVTAVLADLCTLAASFLLVDASEVDADGELLDMGFDSISMTDLVTQLNDGYGLELLPTVLFECPTLAGLADYLVQHHAAAVRARVPAEANASAADNASIPAAAAPPPATRGDPPPASRVATGGSSPRHGTDIAVIGMAGSMPGSASLDEFWRHLAAGHDLVRHVPEDREELLDDPRTRHLVGGFLDGVAEFDAELFGVAPREAALMDPQQRLFLQSAWLAIADAGYRQSDLAGSRTGVFAGVSTNDYDDLMTLNGVPVEAHMATGLSHAILPNRVSHLLDLHGPSEAVDTACSSALVAVHRAVRALRSGECDVALAGGVSVTLTPGLFVAFMESGMLSRSGRCRTFDKAADGYVRGEGVGAILLKPLDRALADGDHVYASIKGSAVNHGGRASSLTAPNPQTQAEVLAAAYADAGVDVATISYLEAHGTGTKLGDPVEIEGIKKAFELARRESSTPVTPGATAIGSVKTNIGHLEAAAGIAGLLKVLLAMRHGQLPPHLHLEEPNPHIKLDGTPFVINDRLRPWPSDRVRRAGVSSFGFGGTNAHVVVEDAPDVRAADGRTPAGPLVFPLSAPDPKRLAAYALQLAARLDSDHEFDLARVAYTLQTGREALTERLAVVATNRAGVLAALHAGARREEAQGVCRGTATASGAANPATDDEDTLAAAWVSGAVVDWASRWSEKPRRVPLPTFPLARTRHWFAHPAQNGSSSVSVSAPTPTPPSPPPVPSPPFASSAVGSNGHAEAPAGAVADALRRHLAELLGISEAHILSDQPFHRLGLDSIFAIDLAQRLSDAYGREIQAAQLYDHDTIDDLAAFLDAGAERQAAPVGPTPAEAVARVLEGVVGHAIDEPRSFVDNGFTSLDMLRAIGELEDRLGVLPKTLLFDQPNLAALTRHLCELHGERAVTRLATAADSSASLKLPDEGSAGAPGASATAGSIIAKRALADNPVLAEVVGDLSRRYGVESGLAGRDIAPRLFVSSGNDGYLEFAQTAEAVLAWSYTGPPEAFGRVVDEFVAYARNRALQPNILSPTPIGDIAGTAFTATPFGVVQQLEELASFSLEGGTMRRLRGAVNRFTKSGRCEVVEYVPGTDAAVDLAIVELIDEWSGGKSTVNPYVQTLREDVRRGALGPDHRVFLTKLDGVVIAALVLTGMQSENGYLLDVEFYRRDMALGGLEYALVKIIEVLRAESVAVFSFGATFGVKVCDSPNASRTAEQTLEELTSAGIAGTGNYRFKSKFRPQELPIYLCQPVDNASDIGAVMLMIATGEPEPSPPARAVPPARETILAAAGWNPLRLAHLETEIDLLTDSWAEREDAWITDRMRGLIGERKTPAAEDRIQRPWLPFSFVTPAPSGRSAEAAFCRAWVGRRGVVLHNGLFPTWLFSLAEQRFTPVPLVGPSGHDPTFVGDISIQALDAALAEHGEEVSFVVVEPGSNSGGGRPTSLANLRELKSRLGAAGVPLVLDASRIVENAVAIVQHEDGPEERDAWAAVREVLELADAATLSLSKDFGVSFGGLAASNLPELTTRLRDAVETRGTDVSVPNLRVLQAALADGEVAVRSRARVEAVRALWQRLAEADVPVVAPAGGHCVLLDTARISELAAFAHPVEACLAWIYRHTGIRAGPHLSGGGAHRELERCIRLAVPVGMSRGAADHAAERLAQLFHGDVRPVDLVAVSGSQPQDATYRLAEDVRDGGSERPRWFKEQLRELGASLQRTDYAPANENLEVLREFHPAVECRMVGDRDGDVEVFVTGDGPTLVLMHPFNIGAGMFAPQMAGLSDRFRMIVVHQPGVGRTTVRSELSLEGLATLQRRVLTTVGVDGPFHVAGASVGGIFAEYLSLRYPEDILSLSLIGGSYKFANRKGQIDKLEQVVAEDFDSMLAGSRSVSVARERDRLTRLLLRCESMDGHTGLRYLDLFEKEPDLTPRLGEISVPTLILQGRHDSVVGVKTGHFLHGAIPDARYVELPESGHFLCFTDPEAVNRELVSFFEQATPQPGGVR